MRGHKYDKTMRHFWLDDDHTSARDALHYVVQSMGAIAWMTRCTLLVDNEGEGIPAEMAEGLYQLLEQQCAMLNGLYEELGVEDAERAAKNEERGIVAQSRIPTEALTEAAHKLRVAFIASQTEAGVEPGLIGAALNLSGDDIGRVVARLRGETAPRSRAPRAAQA